MSYTLVLLIVFLGQGIDLEIVSGFSSEALCQQAGTELALPSNGQLQISYTCVQNS